MPTSSSPEAAGEDRCLRGQHDDPDNTGQCVRCNAILDPLDAEERAQVDERLAREACAFAEREFLNASVAVWREIDRLSTPGPYRGLDASNALRQREREAWERYRDLVLDEARAVRILVTFENAPNDQEREDELFHLVGVLKADGWALVANGVGEARYVAFEKPKVVADVT